MITNSSLTVYHNIGLQDAISYTEMPTANETNLGQIAKYIGETTLSYTKDHYYKCVKEGTLSPTYSWENADDIGNLLPIEIWNRYNYDKVWFFGGKGAGINKGYDNANDVQVRIPYDQNNGLNISDFAIGDILVQGTLDIDIETQEDLSNYDIYNITSINNNNFGNSQHIHLGGK